MSQLSASNGAPALSLSSQVGFSFKMGAAPVKKKVQAQEVRKTEELEFVHEIRDNKIIGDRPEVVTAPLVIPLSQGWKTESASQDGAQSREPEAPKVEIKAESIAKVMDNNQYGLIQIKAKEDGHSEAPRAPVQPGRRDGPLLLKSRPPGWHDIADEDERFKFDVESRPDDNVDYEKVPLDLFGEAALRGMGWKPGEPIGLSNKQTVEVVELTKRQHRLGLGAEPKMPDMPKKGDSRSDSRDSRDSRDRSSRDSRDSRDKDRDLRERDYRDKDYRDRRDRDSRDRDDRDSRSYRDSRDSRDYRSDRSEGNRRDDRDDDPMDISYRKRKDAPTSSSSDPKRRKGNDDRDYDRR